jgi:hypothetical protein
MRAGARVGVLSMKQKQLFATSYQIIFYLLNYQENNQCLGQACTREGIERGIYPAHF